MSYPQGTTTRPVDSGTGDTIDTLVRLTGCRPVDVANLVGPVLAVDHTYRASADVSRDPLVAPAVRWALLHGLTVEEISDYLGVPYTKIARHAGTHNAPSPQAVHAVALAKGGRSGTEIIRELNLTGKGWLYRVLEHARVKPQPLGQRAATTSEQRIAAVLLYDAGKTYSEIATSTGMTVHNVKNVLRAAHARGDLDSYGQRKAGRR
jgi:hypothetical protein